MLTLFLDLDGVLTTYSWVKQFKRMSDKCPLDPRCVYWLNKLINEHDFDIVSASSWNIGHSLDEIKRIYELGGVKKSPIDQLTYHVKLNKEIKKEVATKKYVENKSIKKFLIVDDLPFQFDKVFATENIYMVDHGWDRDGIDLHHYKEILKRINTLQKTGEKT